MNLTAERLREVLNYDPMTGIFTRRISDRRVKAGMIAGCLTGAGYWGIRIDSRRYLAHRLAWLYVYGQMPTGDLDHKDNYKTHNWIKNLRLATTSQNGANSRRQKNNASGFKGVIFRKNRGTWVARIMFNNQRLHIGSFPTSKEAHTAYIATARKLFGEFARAE